MGDVRKMENIRVLLVYPNLMLVSLLPNNIALLSGALKREGFDVKVFDSTLYKTTEKTNDELRVERMQVRKFNIDDAGIKIKEKDIFDEFKELVKEFKPHLIGVSVVDDTVKMGLDLIQSANTKNIPVIFGGVHAIVNSEELISNSNVDMICVGEGEKTIVELCKRIQNKESYVNIENLWIKKENGKIIRNNLGKAVDLDDLPYEEFSVFEKQRIYRPMQGKMLAVIPINFDRGCPYRCTFCDAPSLLDYYKKAGIKYYRIKSIERIYKEMKYQTSNNNVSYFYFNSETFLAMSENKLKEFAKMYSEFNLPFWCQTRIETVTEEKIRLLKEMNCDRISIGIEHGNEEFRNSILKKTFTNEQLLKAFEILNKYNLKISVNNMLGFPDETRELVFDTIRLNRRIKADSINGFVFQPYLGTYLRDYCIEKGYLLKDIKVLDSSIGSPIGKSILDMPQMSKGEIEGLLRTFVLYVKMPEEYFPRIRKAEELSAEGDSELAELREILFNKYFT